MELGTTCDLGLPACLPACLLENDQETPHSWKPPSSKSWLTHLCSLTCKNQGACCVCRTSGHPGGPGLAASSEPKDRRAAFSNGDKALGASPEGLSFSNTHYQAGPGV